MKYLVVEHSPPPPLPQNSNSGTAFLRIYQESHTYLGLLDSWTGKVKTGFPQSNYPLTNKISISIWYKRTIILPDKDVFMNDETTDIVEV